MDYSTKIIIYDTDGNCIFDNKLMSPFVGINTGETFWYGTESEKKWGKIVKVTYGLDTTSQSFVIEMVVEDSQRKDTKELNPEFKVSEVVNHGDKRIKAEGGASWSINDGDIVVTAGRNNIFDKKVKFTLQINSEEGPQIKSLDNVKAGTYLEIKNKARKVVATLISVELDYYHFRITEAKFSK